MDDSGFQSSSPSEEGDAFEFAAECCSPGGMGWTRADVSRIPSLVNDHGGYDGAVLTGTKRSVGMTDGAMGPLLKPTYSKKIPSAPPSLAGNSEHGFVLPDPDPVVKPLSPGQAEAKPVFSALVVHEINNPDAVVAMASTPRRLFCGLQNGHINVFEFNFFRNLRCLTGHQRTVTSLQVASGLLYSSSSDNTVRVWCVDGLQCVRVLPVGVTVYATLPLGSYLFVACLDTTVKQYSVSHIVSGISEEGCGTQSSAKEIAPVRELRGHTGFVYALESTDSSLFSCSGDGTIRVTNIYTGKVASVLEGHQGSVTCLLAVGELLFSGGTDKTVKLWLSEDLRPYFCKKTFRGHTEDVVSLQYDRLSRLLYVALADGSIFVWDTTHFYLLTTIAAHPSREGGVLSAIMVDRFLLTAGSDKVVKFWQASLEGAGGMPLGSQRASAIHLGEVANPGLSAAGITPDIYSKLMLQRLSEFVAIPTISGVEKRIGDCDRGSKYLKALLLSLGAEVRLAQEIEGKNMVVLGRLNSPGATKTICVYGHYDVVSAPSRAEQGWHTPPFKMTGKDGYIYGRGVTDNKGPILATLFAVQELIDTTGSLPVNIRFIYEGEEECSSGGFIETVKAHSDFVGDCDAILCCNSYWIGEEKPCLVYGFRGAVHMLLKIEGTAKPMHSGVSGGIFHEPLAVMMSLLSRVFDSKEMKVLVPGFYDKVCEITQDELDLYEDIDLDIEEYRTAIGVKKFACNDRRDLLMRMWREPTMSFHDINTGTPPGTDATGLIPHECTCRLSMRLVPNQDKDEIINMVTAAIQKEFDALESGNLLTVSCRSKGEWWVGDTKNEAFLAARRALQTVWGVKPLFTREGGTLPVIPLLEKNLKVPAVQIPLGQCSDQAHLANERCRLENLVKGKAVIRAFLSNFGSTSTNGSSTS